MPIWMRFERQVQAGILMLASVLFLALANGNMAQAQTSQSDIDELLHGEALAKANCGQCHSIGLEGNSPNEKAPPFRTLSERRDIETIAGMLYNKQSPEHTGMPQLVDSCGDPADIVSIGVVAVIMDNDLRIRLFYGIHQLTDPFR